MGQRGAAQLLFRRVGPPIGLRSEVFVLVSDRTETKWEIHVHQTLD